MVDGELFDTGRGEEAAIKAFCWENGSGLTRPAFCGGI